MAVDVGSRYLKRGDRGKGATGKATDVGVRDLKRSFRVHRAASEAADDGPCRYLLLFYGVECGLKAAHLGPRGAVAGGTGELPVNLRNHDIRLLAENLKLAHLPEVRDLRPCRRKHDSAAHVSVGELHEAWRYGATLDPEDEKRVVVALRGLAVWCEKEYGS